MMKWILIGTLFLFGALQNAVAMDGFDHVKLASHTVSSHAIQSGKYLVSTEQEWQDSTHLHITHVPSALIDYVGEGGCPTELAEDNVPCAPDAKMLLSYHHEAARKVPDRFRLSHADLNLTAHIHIELRPPIS